MPDFHFQAAEFVASDARTPPASGWRPVALPDSWLRNHPNTRGIGWYRMRFHLDAVPPPGMALYVSRVSRTGQFWLNGSVLNPDVRFNDGGTSGTNSARNAHLVPLPSGLFRVGENELHVRVHGIALGADGLWTVRIGALDRLYGPWLVRDIVQRIIPQALLALMVTGAVLALIVWWRDRRARSLQFAGAMVTWTVAAGTLIVPTAPPVSLETIATFVTLIVIVFHWLLLDLFYRYSGSSWHWYPRVLNVVCALSFLTAVAIVVAQMGRSPRFSENMGVALMPLALLRVLATVMLMQAAWRQRSGRSFALAAAEVVWFAGNLQLIFIMLGWLSPEPFRLDPACSLPLFLVLLYFFAEHYVRDREQAAREQQAAIDAERARILQDMHDGMGAQLVTALRLAQRPDSDRALLARNIEEALHDLRAIIESLDAGNRTLTQLLGDLCSRLEPRLAASGIRLEWDFSPHAGRGGLSPSRALAVLRIVQEALNNAVKHARPTVIRAFVAAGERGTIIGVSDDGIGFDRNAGGNAGRGLATMHNRARQLGATLTVQSQEGAGTSVALHLPPGVASEP